MRFFGVILLILTTSLAWADTTPSCHSVFGAPSYTTPQKYEALVESILSLEVELVSLAATKGYKLNQAVCRGAAGTMKDLLKYRLGIEAEVVYSGYHNMLIFRDFFGNGEHFFIDPNYKAFIAKNRKGIAQEPNVIVGTSSDIKSVLIRLGAESYVETYHYGLRTETLSPTWLLPRDR
jgi:hypothetical protein